MPKKNTKEEEIGNITDNEFQIMIVKIIQNLENKMELQINSLWIRIEKMQGKTMAPHSSTLAWKIPWTEEPGRLQSMGWQRVRHDRVTSLSFFV